MEGESEEEDDEVEADEDTELPGGAGIDFTAPTSSAEVGHWKCDSTNSHSKPLTASTGVMGWGIVQSWIQCNFYR